MSKRLFLFFVIATTTHLVACTQFEPATPKVSVESPTPGDEDIQAQAIASCNEEYGSLSDLSDGEQTRALVSVLDDVNSSCLGVLLQASTLVLNEMSLLDGDNNAIPVGHYAVSAVKSKWDLYYNDNGHSPDDQYGVAILEKLVEGGLNINELSFKGMNLLSFTLSAGYSGEDAAMAIWIINNENFDFAKEGQASQTDVILEENPEVLRAFVQKKTHLQVFDSEPLPGAPSLLTEVLTQGRTWKEGLQIIIDEAQSRFNSARTQFLDDGEAAIKGKYSDALMSAIVESQGKLDFFLGPHHYLKAAENYRNEHSPENLVLDIMKGQNPENGSVKSEDVVMNAVINFNPALLSSLLKARVSFSFEDKKNGSPLYVLISQLKETSEEDLDLRKDLITMIRDVATSEGINLKIGKGVKSPRSLLSESTDQQKPSKILETVQEILNYALKLQNGSNSEDVVMIAVIDVEPELLTDLIKKRANFNFENKDYGSPLYTLITHLKETQKENFSRRRILVNMIREVAKSEGIDLKIGKNGKSPRSLLDKPLDADKSVEDLEEVKVILEDAEK